MSIKVLAGMSKKRLMFFAPVYTVFLRDFHPDVLYEKRAIISHLKRGRRRRAFLRIHY